MISSIRKGPDTLRRVGFRVLAFWSQHPDLTIDGLLFFDGDSDDASLNPALNTAMLLERFIPMASNAEKKVAYQVRMRSSI